MWPQIADLEEADAATEYVVGGHENRINALESCASRLVVTGVSVNPSTGKLWVDTSRICVH